MMIQNNQTLWSVETPTYRWAWDSATDGWTLTDSRNRSMVRGTLRPKFLFADGSEDPSLAEAAVRVWADGTTLTQVWKAREAQVTQSWTFFDDHFALAPLEARSPFAPAWARIEQLPDMATHYALLPGISMSSSLPPVIDLHTRLKVTTTLGAGAMRGPGLAQQWGLPAHWFAVYDTADRWNAAGAQSRESDALCIGLADLPDGDFWVRTDDRTVTPLLNVRSDLWNLFAAGESVVTGLSLLFFVGKDLQEAPRAWYRHHASLGNLAGSAYPAASGPRDIRPWVMFNTWGSQVSEPIQPEQLNQARLESYKAGLTASGMKTALFVVDDKWEGAYGVLEHDAERFPRFEAFLDQLRNEGSGVGLWAAFLRCEDPKKVGLDERHLMKGKDGQVLWFQHQTARYGLYDITHPEVVPVLTGLARRFMERYRPDLIKFDFGYELPILDVGIPFDRAYRGEKLLRRGLEVLIGAMKAVNPRLAVMYYGISPLVAPYFDLHSLDDMVYCPRDYDVEGNRRLALASLLSEVGMPVSSSTGYDWASATSLWFDAAASGIPGSLLPFGPDEAGGAPSQTVIAAFNGLAAIACSGAIASVEPLDGHPHGGHRAMTVSSWRRKEGGRTVLLALREGTRVPELESSGQFVLASLDGLDMIETRHAGLVPLTPGRLRWPTPGRSRWKVTLHGAGGTTEERMLVGREVVEFEFGSGIGPLEWVEFRGD